MSLLLFASFWSIVDHLSPPESANPIPGFLDNRPHQKKETTLFADNLTDDFACSGSCVEVDQDYLLPCSQCHLAIDDGH